MADIFPAGPIFRVLPAQNGQILAYGSTSDENPRGVWTFTFYGDAFSDAIFSVMTRPPRISTADTTVPWMPMGYRRVVLNNLPADYSTFVSGDGNGNPIPVSNQTMIEVPANGRAIGLLVAMTVGQTMVYANFAEGAAFV